MLHLQLCTGHTEMVDELRHVYVDDKTVEGNVATK